MFHNVLQETLFDGLVHFTVFFLDIGGNNRLGYTIESVLIDCKHLGSSDGIKVIDIIELYDA